MGSKEATYISEASTNGIGMAEHKPTTVTTRSSLHLVTVAELTDLYAENVAAKIWSVANSYLEQHPTLDTYPEYVPESGPCAGKYESKTAKFWTCGFFPASLYCILERCAKYPHRLPLPAQLPVGTRSPAASAYAPLLALCRSWSAPLRAQATRTDTHDLGFMMHPLRMDWELTGEPSSLQACLTAAESLATRYNEKVGAIRSWDQAVSRTYEIRDKENNFLIIVDSMCNMDLLFYAAHHAHTPRFATIAARHARTVLATLVRPDFSTWHVANLDQHSPQKGTVQHRMTHQGFADGSTWARGQGWAVLGFAQTYGWTGDMEFLDACRRLANRFIARLLDSPAVRCPWVPLWDFDDTSGEMDSTGDRLRDASAGMIAANGMLLLHQALQAAGAAGGTEMGGKYDGRRYLDAALNIARDTITYALDRTDEARLEVDPKSGKVKVLASGWNAILRHSTANNNSNAAMRYKDHGLVYADYYFLEFGNRLLRMGLA